MFKALLNKLVGRLAPLVAEKLAPIAVDELRSRLDYHLNDVVLPNVSESVRKTVVHDTAELVTALLKAELDKRPLLKPEPYLPTPMESRPERRVCFLQTADAVKYRPLLELTSKTIREYCARHDFSHETFIGVVRGYHAWQASYNRIPLLRRIAVSGFIGWVCYMDADAYIADLDFDLASYLKDKWDIAIVLAPGAGDDIEWWNVNDGVFLLNLSHPKGRLIVEAWNYLFGQVTEEELRSREEWYPENHDQTLLWYVLQGIPDLRRHVVIDRVDRIINYRDGRFIRQALRADGTLQDRLELVDSEIKRVLGQATS